MRIVVLDKVGLSLLKNILLYKNYICMFKLSLTYPHLFVGCWVSFAMITCMVWANDCRSWWLYDTM